MSITVAVSILVNTHTALQIATEFRSGISGYVWDAANGNPVQDAIIDIWNASGILYSSTSTSANGGFSIYLNDLNSGNEYYLSTDVPPDYLNQVYDNLPCLDGPAVLGLCDALQGQVLSLAAPNPSHAVVELSLESSGAIFSSGFE